MQEPFRLARYQPTDAQPEGEFYTCARPGRSLGSTDAVDDKTVEQWAAGLPGATGTVIVSLLGKKPYGMSEFSFYSFRGGREAEDRPDDPTFQEWLDERFESRQFEVIEVPTVDTVQVDSDSMDRILIEVSARLKAGRTVVLVDSGGVGRTGQVRKHLGFKP